MAFNAQQAQAEINALKVRVFDAEEQSRQLSGTLQQFSGALAQVLDLGQDEAQDPQQYIDAIVALKAFRDAQGESGDVEPSDE